MLDVKQGSAQTLMLYVVDSTTEAPKTGLTLTLEASKGGAAFASITPSVVERGGGWYAVTLSASHTDTLGDLVLNCTNSGSTGWRAVGVVENIEADTFAQAGLIKAKTDLIPASPASSSEVAAILTTTMTEAYAADGSTMTVAQALYMIRSVLMDKGISGTTMTCRRLDGSTAAMTFTLDSETAPTSITRVS